MEWLGILYIRHSIYIEHDRLIGQKMLPWGRANLVAAGEVRKAYIDALRAADGEEIEPLIAFAERY